MDKFFQLFSIVNLTNKWPIPPKDKQPDKSDIFEDSNVAFDLIKLVHGSFENIPNLVDAVLQKYPSASKNSVKKKLKIIAEKKKIEGKQKNINLMRWIINEDYFNSLGLKSGEQEDLILEKEVEYL